ncbi:SRPBCC family protein [Mycolicibacillus parakoreensis]|uniref:SRPBCC family protein n=2 Tax=Mycobacteriaceae TaxID=1762 RepID=A0ABY3U7L7_9MYCO|nr:SRPBCC family protein [Mycolicibacillus parakoreensis]MCV7315154.1 SRPBCC family protein [Mycolicibacillus parakoreensis]ULN53502.1 SRPBCC family protein [Mycolicibacillus parakoreensis]HLR98701.1 SRPBCC family protein [Mycolicibacillus parakoreensis]
MAGVTRAVRIASPVDDVAKIATDPAVVFPIMGSFGRFEFLTRNPDGSEEWDLYLNVGSIYVGGRVRVPPPSGAALRWQSLRGTRQWARIEVAPTPEGARVAMTMQVRFAGRLTGWLTGQLARGILARNMEAGLQQLRHHIEYGPA